MIVVKCDKCGIIYNPDYLILDYTDTKSPSRIKYTAQNGNEWNFDLCPVCAKDFKRWMGVVQEEEDG